MTCIIVCVCMCILGMCVCMHLLEHLCVSILCVLHISHFEYVCLSCMWLVCHHHYNTSTVSIMTS